MSVATPHTRNYISVCCLTALSCLFMALRLFVSLLMAFIRVSRDDYAFHYHALSPHAATNYRSQKRGFSE